MTTGTTARLIENTAARLTKAVERVSQIVDTQGDVVQARPALVDEFGDGGIGCGGFEQFDARPVGGRSGGKHGDTDALDFHGFGVRYGHAESLLVEAQAFFEAAHGYA